MSTQRLSRSYRPLLAERSEPWLRVALDLAVAAGVVLTAWRAAAWLHLLPASSAGPVDATDAVWIALPLVAALACAAAGRRPGSRGRSLLPLVALVSLPIVIGALFTLW